MHSTGRGPTTTPVAAATDGPQTQGRHSVVHMAMIAKVLTQDGPAAAGTAIEGAGADAGVEFLALLSGVAGAAPAPVVGQRPPPAEEPQLAADPGSALAASLAALAAAGVVERLPASASPAPRHDGPPARTQAPATPSLPLPDAAALLQTVVATDAEPLEAPVAGRAVPAAAPPPNASPVAVAVLQALQSGQRPPPAHAVAPPPGAAPVPDPLPVTDAVARLADAIDGMAAGDAGAQAESDPDGVPGGAPGAALTGGPVMRDVAAGAVYQRSVPGTVGTPAWRQALGAELQVMVERGVGAATLRLSPEHLGPVEVRIDFNDDRANVWFSAPHADTRAALADALPRLRDMLASVGVNLGETGVQRDLPGQSGRQDGTPRGAAASLADTGAESRVVVTRLDAGRGMVDEYA